MMSKGSTLSQTSNPWTPYDQVGIQGNNGKAKGHPVTPESGTYGGWLVGFCLLLFILARLTSPKLNNPK